MSSAKTIALAALILFSSGAQPALAAHNDPKDVAAVSGFVQPVELVFYGATTTGDASGNGRLADGDIDVGGKDLELLPMRCSPSGNVTAKFVFASGEDFSVTAQALECFATGERTFVEAYGV